MTLANVSIWIFACHPLVSSGRRCADLALAVSSVALARHLVSCSTPLSNVHACVHVRDSIALCSCAFSHIFGQALPPGCLGLSPRCVCRESMGAARNRRSECRDECVETADRRALPRSPRAFGRRVRSGHPLTKQMVGRRFQRSGHPPSMDT